MLNGPRLAPNSGGKAKSLVVFIHGYGANGDDLIDIGRHWGQILTDTAFSSPHAPEPCAGAPMGRQWFALTMRDPSETWRGTSAAAAGLNAYLDSELKRLALDDTKLALVGFSQGTMMALHVGLRRARGPGAILGYSGMLAGPEHLGEAIATPPILLIHGDQDQVLPVGFMFAAAQALGEAGRPARFHVCPGLGHGIDGDGLRLGGQFLSEALA